MCVYCAVLTESAVLFKVLKRLMRAVHVNLQCWSLSLPKFGYFTASMFPCTVRNEADCQCLKACWYSFRKCFLRVSNCCYMLLLRSLNEVQCRENETKLKAGGEKAVNHQTAISAGGFPSVLPFVQRLCFPVL
jgi:hypothetical protein